MKKMNKCTNYFLGLLLICMSTESMATGSIDSSSIRSKLIDHLPKFKTCFQSEIDRSERDTFSGKIELNFLINKNGEVVASNLYEINNTEPDLDIRDCLSEVLSKIEFARNGMGTVEVKQVMNFYTINN